MKNHAYIEELFILLIVQRLSIVLPLVVDMPIKLKTSMKLLHGMKKTKTVDALFSQMAYLKGQLQHYINENQELKNRLKKESKSQ